MDLPSDRMMLKPVCGSLEPAGQMTLWASVSPAGKWDTCEGEMRFYMGKDTPYSVTHLN